MKRILLVVAALVVVLVGVRQLVLVLASDETRIEWLIEDMANGFNDRKAGAATAGLANDWKHEGSQVDKPFLRGALLQEFTSFGKSKRGQELYRVEMPDEQLSITVEGDTAELSCEANFAREHDGSWSTVWRMRIEARLAKGEDGWEIRSSRHEDLEGWGLR